VSFDSANESEGEAYVPKIPHVIKSNSNQLKFGVEKETELYQEIKEKVWHSIFKKVASPSDLTNAQFHIEITKE
jgi:hypothetical protein